MNESYDYARRQLVAVLRDHANLSMSWAGDERSGVDDTGLGYALLHEASRWALIVIALKEQHGS